MKVYINANREQIAHNNGIFGDGFEVSVKRYLGLKPVKSPKNKRDLIYRRKYYEVKQGAFEFGTELTPDGLRSAFKGSGYVIFTAKMDQTSDGWGWFDPAAVKVYKKADFINAIIQYYTFTDRGILKLTKDKAHLQGLWSATKNAPHGKKIYKFVPYIETFAIGTLEDLKNGKI